jgi:nitroreductase
MLKDLVLKNRSYRGFDEKYKVSAEILKDLVDVARLTASGANAQPLKYLLIADEEGVGKMNYLTRWGKMLKDVTLPHPGQFPTAYILIVVDTGICKDPNKADTDVGIAAQTILLTAVEKELGGCMIGNFDKELAAKTFLNKAEYVPVLAIAIGKPVETIKLVEVGEDGSTKYYRDETDTHYVPKRKLEDILI